jgi:hypothetical protein
MIKCYIAKTERARFKNIFEFLTRYNSKAYIGPEGIDFTNASGAGKISSAAFVNYQVAGNKRLTLLDDSKAVKAWIAKWEEKENGLIEIEF